MAVSLADLRSALHSTPDVYRALLAPLSASQLQVNEGPGTWSPYQVLCHVTWGEVDDWMPRVRRLLERGVEQAFEPFDREAGFARYDGWTVDRLLDEFARLRAANLAAFDGLALAPADLVREGRHPEFGVVTLGQLLATWITHDYAHISQIARVLARHHGARVGPWTKYFSLLSEPA
jgi:hypothetical protein